MTVNPDQISLIPGDIEGAKKGATGGGTGTSSNPTNTLRSAATMYLVDLIGEGPIALAEPSNPLNCIYFNKTPIENFNASPNFFGVTVAFHEGTPDQPPFYGNPTAETPFQVNTQLTMRAGSISRTITDPDVTSVRIVVSIPSLEQTDSQGNIQAAATSWNVRITPNGGSMYTAASYPVYGLSSSAYQMAVECPLPVGGAPWVIRVARTSPDSDRVTIQNDTYWDSYTEITQGLFTYMNTACCSIIAQADQFGGNVPTRFYNVTGLIIQVPSNYDAVAKTYTGIWDGSFINHWTSNPAWILYDILTNTRYGIGQFIDASAIDKWSLYQIGQYCDQLIPDGYGGTEPRYTFNGAINTRQEAFKVIQQICAAFRGMAYWSVGQVFAFADMPADPVKLVSRANVIDGSFEYSGTALKTRHSVALVSWNDPGNFYSPTTEVVIDEAELEKWGWRETNIQGYGITSRGLAHRMGKWALDTEKTATETISYAASWDHADVVPGDIIAVADPNKAQVRAGGRIAAVSGLNITIDGDFTPTFGQTYNLMATMPDGTVQSDVVATFSGRVLTLTSGYTATPVIGAMWVLTGDVVPRQYRVISVAEEKDYIFKVTALFHDPTKYDRIEEGIYLPDPTYTLPKTTIDPPTNLQVVENLYFLNGAGHSRLVISWTQSADFLAQSYSVNATMPGGYEDFGLVTPTSIIIDDAAIGDYTINVSSYSNSGIYSVPATVTYTAKGWGGAALPFVSHLEIFGQGTDLTFASPDCTLDWTNNFPAATSDVGQEASAGAGYENPLYRDNLISIYDVATGTLLRTEDIITSNYVYTFAKNVTDNATFGRDPQRSFKVSVTVRDNLGNQSAPVTITPNNPVPPIIIPVVEGTTNSVFVRYVPPTDADFLGAFVWLSTDPDFDPLTTTPAYQGPNNFLVLAADPGSTGFKTYYVRMAGFDSFGTSNLNISPPQSVLVGNTFTDTSSPGVPTGVILSSVLETMPDGTVQSDLIAIWDASLASNFANFEAAISISGGNYVSTPCDLPTFEWRGLIAGQTYLVKVRSVSINGFKSAYSTPVSITLATKLTGPGLPTGLTVAASLKAAYLQWTNPSDTDLAGVEIWASATSTLSDAVLAGSSQGSGYTEAGLATGVAVYYWLRAFNTSGIRGSFTASPVAVTPGQVANGDIAANSITADRIVAGSITGDRLNVSTAFPASITIGTTGVSIGAMTDPASLVNAGTTLIAPGLIQLSGATTLSSWRDGTDATKISGGSIAANTIAANSLTIGLRGLALTGLAITYNTSTGAWATAAGTISYYNDVGSYVTVSIAAGSGTLSPASNFYVIWTKDATGLYVGPTNTVNGNNILFATYTPASGLIVTYGQTLIDGSNIVANSVQGAAIVAGSITASKIAAGTITATQIATGAITADLIAAGTISAASNIYLGDTTFALSATNKNLVVEDGSGHPRVILGSLGGGDYGLKVLNADGSISIQSSGTGTILNGNILINGTVLTDALAPNAVTNTAFASGSGQASATLFCKGGGIVLIACSYGGNDNDGGSCFLHISVDGTDIVSTYVPSINLGSFYISCPAPYNTVWTSSAGVHVFRLYIVGGGHPAGTCSITVTELVR